MGFRCSSKIFVAMAAMAFASLPVYGSTAILLFNVPTGQGSGTASTSNNNASLSAFSVLLSNLTISSAPDGVDNNVSPTITGTNMSWSSATDLFTYTVNFGQHACDTAGCNLDNSSITFQGYINFTNGSTTPKYSVTGSAGTQTLNVLYGTLTNLTVTDTNNALTDLGLGENVVATITSGGLTSTALDTASGGIENWANMSSETLNLTLTSTPEPVSLLMLGSGLLGIGLIARKRKSK